MPGFVRKIERLTFPGYPPQARPCVYGVWFDRAAFDTACFERAGISLPDPLLHAVTKRQAEFLAGRLAARLVLAELGVKQQVAIDAQRAPCWPAGIQGSISHCDDWAVATVCPERDGCTGLGLDLENWLQPSEVLDLAPAILTDAERQQFLPQADAFYWVTLVFSAKESLFKALYPQVGRYFDFQDAELIRLEPDRQEFELVLRQPLTERLPAGSRFVGHWQQWQQRLLTGILVKGPVHDG